MTFSPEDVYSGHRAIESAGEDWETAHSKEDILLWRIVEAIADGTATDPRAVCAAMLERDTSADIRWWA